MRRFNKRILLFSLVLITMMLSFGFVSASENMTGEVILEDVSSQEHVEEIDDGLEESVEPENSKIDTKISVKDSNSYYKEKIIVDIYLKDSNNVALNNKSVTVYFNGKTIDKTTDNLGKVSLSYSNLKPNVYKGIVKFEGEGQYNASQSNFNVKINKIPLAIKTKNFNVYEKTNMFFKATVINKVTGAPVSGIRVLFNVYSSKTKKYSNFYKTTDANGIATLNKNFKVGSYKISTKIKDSKNKKYILYKNSKNKVTLTVKHTAESGCCSFYLQVSSSESITGFRRDSTKTLNIYIKPVKWHGRTAIKQYKIKYSYFFHSITTSDGWMIGTGGMDTPGINKAIEKLAGKMVKANKFKKSYLKKIQSYKKRQNLGHFLIKSPDGRYAVVWLDGYQTGKLKPGEYICVPNSKSCYHQGKYIKFNSNPLKAAIKIGASDVYGTKRRDITLFHWKSTTDENFKTTSLLKAYAANDNGKFVGMSSGRFKDDIYFKNKFISKNKLPNVPKMKFLGTHKFGNIDKLVKIPTVIKAPEVTNQFNQSKYFKITVKNKKTGKYIANLKIKMKIITGNETKTYTIRTDNNGLAKFNTKCLLVGTHKVILYPATNKYLISAKSTIGINE